MSPILTAPHDLFSKIYIFLRNQLITPISSNLLRYHFFLYTAQFLYICFFNICNIVEITQGMFLFANMFRIYL